MSSLFGEICHIFCCPPRPSHIVAKFAFLPPLPTYSIVQSSDGNEWQIVFKPEVGHISDYAKSRMEVFYTMSKRKSRIACLYIRYDPSVSRSPISHSSNSADRLTVLFSHGNAVDIGQMAGFLFSFAQRFGVNVLVYDYSGYGASTGQTLEANLYADAEAALVELQERYHVPLNRIVLYGQSIGTAPTVDLATRHEVAGVVLHSALMSGLRVVCPGTTRRFCFDPFNSIDKVENIQSPTLVIHGTDDHVIGVHHGKELYARLPNPLEPLWVDGADHNNVEIFHEYTTRLERFFQVEMLHAQNSFSSTVSTLVGVEPTRSSVATTTSRQQVPLRPIDERNSWNSTGSSPSVATASSPGRKNRGGSNADVARVDTPPEAAAAAAATASFVVVRTPSVSSASKASLASGKAESSTRSLLGVKGADSHEKISKTIGSSVSLPLETSALSDHDQPSPSGVRGKHSRAKSERQVHRSSGRSSNAAQRLNEEHNPNGGS